VIPAPFTIGSRLVAPGQPALVIAEIGQNHNGQCNLAMELVDAAAWAGADAVKFVKRDLSCELARPAHDAPYQSPHAFGATYGEHRAALELSAEQHYQLAQRVRHHGLLYIGTACDAPSVELFDRLNVDAFKIASRDLDNVPLLQEVAHRRRPLLLSTGMSNLAEVDFALDSLPGTSLALLHCTSLYPAPLADIHLHSLATLRQRYGRLVGFSDHSVGWLLPPVAVALGAVIVEKHLTLDRALPGSDQACSLEPHEFAQMVRNIREVEQALGRADKPIPAQVTAVRAKLGRSLVTRHALAAGTQLEDSMLVLKSPGNGIAWPQRELIVGRTLKRDLPADVTISPADVDDWAASPLDPA
jgi:sialic acid synthase SpsE